MQETLIRLNDLQRLHSQQRDAYVSIFERTLDESYFVNGGEIQEFEREFAEYIGTEHAVAVNSGTDALVLIFKALGIKPGDFVITVANSFVASAHAISLCGAQPIFCDVNLETGAMCSLALQELLQEVSIKNVKAILPVHLWGEPVEWDEIQTLAAKYSIPVVEDACQAHGAVYKGRKVGALGIASAFSFYPGKNLGAMGDAGIICTSDSEIARIAQELRNNGRTGTIEHAVIGMNSRMDTLQAAVLRLKLPMLDGWNTRRRIIAGSYIAAFQSMSEIQVLTTTPDSCVYHQFIILVEDRLSLKHYLFEQGIETGIHYALPITSQDCYPDFEMGTYPNAEFLCSRILSLPIHPTLTDVEVQRVVRTVMQFFNKSST